MGNPIRSERAAFRWLVLVVVIAAVITVVAKLGRPMYGAILLAIVLAVGLVAAVIAARNWYREHRGGPS